MPVPARRLWDWHAAPGALTRLLPPWDPPRVRARTGTSLADMRVEMDVGPAPFGVRWVAQHHDAVEGVRFSDRAERGPFAAWDHLHAFDDAPDGTSVLRDEVRYALPFGRLGELVAGRAIDTMLTRMFAFRHQRTLEDLVRHEAASLSPRRIAVTGASGFLGAQLVAFLQGGGHVVHRLVRTTPSPGSADIAWDPARGSIDAGALEGVDAVIHLAGEGVGERWTPTRRAAILESRVRGTDLLARTLASLQRRPSVLVSASAVGIYGDTGDVEVDEDTVVRDPGADARGAAYLAHVCHAWEHAAEPARAAGIRVVHPRIGVALAADGGALQKMLLPAKLGAGGPIGGGASWLPWIAREDVLGALLHLLATDLAGPVNLVAPSPARQGELARELGRVLVRPSVLPLPAFAVRAMFGEMGEATLLSGQRVRPTRLEQSGFRWLAPSLHDALTRELAPA